MEAEAREILRNSLQAEALPPQLDLGTAIRRHIANLGGVELVLPRREPARRPPK
jgi:antitoxin FitA